MKFDAFEQRARALWEEIPESYRAGVDGLLVERGARAHPDLDEVYTLGECLTETYPSAFGGPDTTRSFVVLHYGSFWRLARAEPDFDWEGELWETLTHELQHHLESLAAEDALEGVDYAADENFRRRQGESFEPLFFRSGESLGGGWYRIEDEYFLEQELTGASVQLEWQGATYRVAVPGVAADVLFVEVAGVRDPPAALTLVLVRPQRLGERLRRLMRGVRPEVREGVADAVLLLGAEAGDE
ncbi:MAG TPA: hypothetical protein VK939_13100 [Longimicrobiales bacterium]|nr:hypothetical protein [Longimicrobiales bacterium]